MQINLLKNKKIDSNEAMNERIKMANTKINNEILKIKFKDISFINSSISGHIKQNKENNTDYINKYINPLITLSSIASMGVGIAGGAASLYTGTAMFTATSSALALPGQIRQFLGVVGLTGENN